jgi:hypothetical protein
MENENPDYLSESYAEMSPPFLMFLTNRVLLKLEPLLQTGTLVCLCNCQA